MKSLTRIWVCLLACLMVEVSCFGADEDIPALKKLVVKQTANLLDMEALQEGIKTCEKILSLEKDDLSIMALLAKIYWSLGNLETNARLQKQWFTKGKEFSEGIKKAHPDRAEGFYWYGIHYGEWVDRSSIFAKIGAKKVILENMERVLAINDKYDGGGAYIVVGRINYIAPGGSYEKAIQCYERAIAIEPRRSTAYLYLGELYLHEHIFDKSDAMFQKVLTLEFDPRYAIEARDDKKAAGKLIRKLDKIDDHFPEQEKITGH